MENKIKISDFAKITGTTVKTIIYYHKIGLLQEPERTSGTYRLYGSLELSRMRLIKRLKSLGLDLKRIKEILGDIDNPKTLREVLESLQVELLDEKKVLAQRIEKIESLLSEDTVVLNEDIGCSPSFQMIIDILGSEKIEKYTQTIPELYEQQRKLHGIVDDFQWGEGYQETYRGLAEYFKAHPEQYQISLNFGVRLTKLDQFSEDDPEVEALARESAEFIKSIPQLKEMLCNKQGMKKHLDALFKDMVSEVLSPARMKHWYLLQQYLNF